MPKHRGSNGRGRSAAIAGVLALLLAAGVASALALTGAGRPAASSMPASSAPSPTATPAPLDPAEALLATTTDPAACVVEFAGEGLSLAPMLQTQGALFAGLPIPRAAGRVFAGWYSTPAEAAVYAVEGRVNGSELVECADRRRTVHAAWTTPDANAAEDAAIPILMYHQFTADPAGDRGPLRLNYAYAGDFDAHMAYIAQGGFYLPTWDELDAFIDGALFLPRRSVIVTDDDAHATWLELAAPIVEKHRVLATSFVITKWRAEGPPNPYVLQRSHTHDMHDPGADGDGRMVNWPADRIVADLETSAGVLGAKEVLAYPFGHHDETAKAAASSAGFLLARTIEQGYVRVGTDKLALPSIRVDYGMSAADLAGRIG